MTVKVLILAFIVSSPLFAAEINCVTEDSAWKISIDYDPDTMVANDVIMLHKQVLYKHFKQIPISTYTSRMPLGPKKTTFYEFDLPWAQYIDLERMSLNGVHEKDGIGQFVKNSSPVTFENHVSCHFID